jgi:hypothetical protein
MELATPAKATANSSADTVSLLTLQISIMLVGMSKHPKIQV